MEHNYLEKCRTCLKNSSKMYQLNMNVRGHNRKLTYSNLLQESTRLEIRDEYERHMPQNICTVCCKELRKAYTFVRQAQFSNTMLMCIIDKHQLNTSEDAVIALGINKNNVKVEDINSPQRDAVATEVEVCSTNVLFRAVKLENETEQEDSLQQNTYAKEFCERTELIQEPIEYYLKADNIEHTSCFEIKSEDNIEHIKVVEEHKKEIENEPFLSLETNWANEERPVKQLDGLEDNTDSERSQVADSNQTLISEIKIEESQIGDTDFESVNKEATDEWLRCHLCPRKYKARNNYVYHLKHKHGITKEHQNIEQTVNHKRKDKTVKCRLCDYVAKNHCRLHYHTRTRHTTEEDKFKCQFCSYKHIMKRKLFNHTKRAHKDLIKNMRAQAKSNTDLGSANSEATILVECHSLEPKSQNASLNTKLQTEETEASSDEEFIKKMLNIKKINYPKRYNPKSWARHCEECGKFCKDYDSFYAHKQIHRKDDEKIPCPHCDKKVNRKSELRGHIKRIHEKSKKQYVCSSCTFATALKSTLNLHFREQHSGERPFKCNICSQSYRSRNVLQEHIRRHNKEKQTCKDCGKLVKHLNAHKRYCCARE